MTPEERAALKAAARKRTDKPEPFFWKGKNRSMQAIVATPEGWAAVLALLDENERMRDCLELLNMIGGLGHKIHHRIDAALSEPGA